MRLWNTGSTLKVCIRYTQHYIALFPFYLPNFSLQYMWNERQNKRMICALFFWCFFYIRPFPFLLPATYTVIFHMDVGLWLYSTTDFISHCTLIVLISALCLLTHMNWLCFNLTLLSGNRIETPSPVTPGSVTGTLSININPKLTHISWGCFNIVKAVLMKEDSDVLMRRQIISHGFCLPLQEPEHTLNSDVLFHLRIDFIIKSQPFDLLNIWEFSSKG